MVTEHATIVAFRTIEDLLVHSVVLACVFLPHGSHLFINDDQLDK